MGHRAGGGRPIGASCSSTPTPGTNHPALAGAPQGSTMNTHVRSRLRLAAAITVAIGSLVLGGSTTAADAPSPRPSPMPVVTRLVEGLANGNGSGSTIGPDHALYVTESAAGRVARIDPHTGAVTTFASGLPLPIMGVGGAMDVAFLHGTAYVLVTLVGADIGGNAVVGIYRVDGPNQFTVIADIGAFSIANPPTTPFDVPTGVQYALQAYRGGFLVTDGHHNRVLRVTLDGEVSEVIQFGNIVPTGLETRGNKVYMAEAGAGPPPARDRQGRQVPGRPSDRHRCGGGGPTPRRRRVRPRFEPLRAVPGPVPRRRATWCPGDPQHRKPRQGHRRRQLQGRRHRTGPTDLG
jgi:hypothetical protein